MQIISTEIPDVKIIEPKIFGDDRGFFTEVYNRKPFTKAGLDFTIIQENLSGSKRGVLRGIHYQIQHSQGKLVRVIKGEVFDVAVDLRKSSPTFGQHISVTLSEENRRQLWVPPGFGHGFYVLSDWAEFMYLVTDIYSPEHERTILWDDPDLGINWPTQNGVEVLVSEKDAKGSPFSAAEVYE